MSLETLWKCECGDYANLDQTDPCLCGRRIPESYTMEELAKVVRMDREGNILHLHRWANDQLRDEFAKAALSAITNPTNLPEYCAKRAYEIADAMLKAREKTNEPSS